MACIKGASRLATMAFAPDSPYLAAGTMAGAVDLSFSSSANLEIFKVDFQSEGWEMPVVGECSSSERFNRISWGRRPSGYAEEFELGLVAGGLADGSIGIWNPVKLMSAEANESMVQRLQRHTGPVRGLAFNTSSPELLASGAENGEVCIWDLENPKEAKLYPALKSPMAGGGGQFLLALYAKRINLPHLLPICPALVVRPREKNLLACEENVGAGSQGEVSFLSWNPRVNHILASCLYNGTTVVWDLQRQKSIISFTDPQRRKCSVLQWHPDKSTELIAAYDDDRHPSLCVWDVRNTLSPSKEFVGHTKGVLAMSWCPYDVSYLLTCAKDNRTICWDSNSGEIVCEVPGGSNWNFDIHWYPSMPGIISASSFDGKIGLYNIEACPRYASTAGDTTGAHLRAPKWMKCPVGASFGFGGKLVSFHSITPSKSEVYVNTVVTETSLVSRSSEFEAAIQNGEKPSMRSLCDLKGQEADSEEEQETWKFLKVMFEDDGEARTKLLVHLGFSLPPPETNENVEEVLSQEISKGLNLDGSIVETHLSGGDLSFSADNGDDFFNNLQSPKAGFSVSALADDFPIESSEKSNGELLQQDSAEISHSSVDVNILRALVVGDYKEAVEQCMSANRMDHALIIAKMGSPSLWESTRSQCLKKSQLCYIEVILGMVNNDLMNLVKTSPLHLWKETLALLCSFAQGDEWTILCDTLASRLMAAGNSLAATLSYICAGNIDKTVEIWSSSRKNNPQGKAYVDLFQDLMEKTIVLALATGQKHFTASFTKLLENYAELLASQGLLTTARKYLKLLAIEDSSTELALLRDRISFSVEEDSVTPLPSMNTSSETQPRYADLAGVGAADASHHYYQEMPPSQPTFSIPGSSYGEGYQQPFGGASYGGGYQPMQPKPQQFQDYVTTPFQPTPSPTVFLPSQTAPLSQPNFGSTPAPSQPPAVKTFVPATPALPKNVEQYQQPTLGSQFYPGVPNVAYHSETNAPGRIPTGPPTMIDSIDGPKLPPSYGTRGFTPMSAQILSQTGVVTPAQPSHLTQAPVQPISAPSAPPPTIQTVDTSKVPPDLKPVIGTLTKLFNETAEALGGLRANPSKKREIEDNSRKIGSLFAKINSGDISPNAATKLGQLCQALDAGDFPGALHIQVLLTTSDWDECNFWLAALKRMIKTRQTARIH